MNTTSSDMDVIAERCPHMMGTTEAHGGSGTSAPDTAVGVFQGIRASLAHVFGSDDPSGRTIAVQGAARVGGVLADLLADVGAKLVISDVDGERASGRGQGRRGRGGRRRDRRRRVRRLLAVRDRGV